MCRGRSSPVLQSILLFHYTRPRSSRTLAPLRPCSGQRTDMLVCAFVCAFVSACVLTWVDILYMYMCMYMHMYMYMCMYMHMCMYM